MKRRATVRFEKVGETHTFRIYASNGRVLASGEFYDRRSKALEAYESLAKALREHRVITLDGEACASDQG